MIHYQKRGQKIVEYWETSFDFRSQIEIAKGCYYEEKFSLIGYDDISFIEHEFEALKNGLKNEKCHYGYSENIYFYNLGLQLGLNGEIQKLEDSIPISEIDSKLYCEIYKEKQISFCSSIEFYSYYVGLRGDKWIQREMHSQKEWLLNLAGYDRYLKEKKNVK